jgi:fructoselysine-6-P-deglycase FrlB-like protein
MARLRSIQAFEREIESQYKFVEHQLLERVDPAKSVMTGSGDSYIAARIASYLSSRRTICCFPRELVLNPHILDGKELFIASVSGRTTHSIAAAKAARKRNVKTTAVTANPNSELARLCDRVIRINYRAPDVLTSGSVGFLLTMLACTSLVTGISVSQKDMRCAHRIADMKINKLIDSIPDRPSSIVYLGDGILYPIASYGSLKMNEVLGVKSFPYSVEEYCHAPLFSIKKNDAIIILVGDGDKKDLMSAMQISQRLRKLDYAVSSLDFSNQSIIKCLLQAVISLQLLALRMAKRRRMMDCFFVLNRELLEISSTCIY